VADAADAERVDFGQLARLQNVAALFDLLIKPSAARGEPPSSTYCATAASSAATTCVDGAKRHLRRALYVHPLVVQILVVLTHSAFCFLPIVDNLQILNFNVKHGKHPHRRGAGADDSPPLRTERNERHD
jgi:hypothetical protein